jgi:hypothetical protein
VPGRVLKEFIRKCTNLLQLWVCMHANSSVLSFSTYLKIILYMMLTESCDF